MRLFVVQKTVGSNPTTRPSFVTFNKYSMSNTINSINNQIKCFKPELTVCNNSKNLEFIDLLFQEGYLHSYYCNSSQLRLKFKYHNGVSRIKHLFNLSRKGQTMLVSFQDLWALNNKSTAQLVLDTSKGFMTSRKACELKIGGYPICLIQ